MEAFRSIDPYNMVMRSEPRISTSNIGLMQKYSVDARIRGLNRLFYGMVIQSKTNDELEIGMLSNLNKKPWYNGMQLKHDKFEKEEYEFNRDKMA